MLKGSTNIQYVWCQSRDDAKISLLRPDWKAKETKIMIEENVLSVSQRGQSLLKEELAYPIEYEEDLDWEIKDLGSTKALVLTVKKKAVMAGGVIWWQRVFKSDPNSIDVSQIQGRKANKELQNSWAQAQEMFKEKMKYIN